MLRFLVAVGLCFSLCRPAHGLPALLGDPPQVEAPTARPLRLVTQFYLDFQYASIPHFVTGGYDADVFRFAAGGSFRLGRVAFDLELPFHASHLHGVAPGYTSNQFALDYVRSGLRVEALDAALSSLARMRLGFAGRVWFPTETTGNYQVHDASGAFITTLTGPTALWHFEPGLLWTIAVGPFSFLTDQGPLILYNPTNGSTPVFWDSHYVFALVPWWRLSFSFDVNALFAVDDDARYDNPAPHTPIAVWILPGMGVYVTRTQRVDLALRIAVSGDATDSPLVERAFFDGNWAMGLRWTIEFPGAPGSPRHR